MRNLCGRCHRELHANMKPRVHGMYCCNKCLADLVMEVLTKDPSQNISTISEWLDMSRQALDQAVKRGAPWRPWEALRTERTVILEEVQRFRITGRCRLCGVWITGDRWHYCCDDHYETYQVIRYHVDPERWKSQHIQTSKWVLQNPDKVPAFQARHAERILNGHHVVHEDRRWLIEGSKAYETALRCYREGWPVFEQFAEPIQKQIIEAARREDREREEPARADR